MTPPTDGHRNGHPNGPDDHALDAFLRGDDALSRALRDVPQPEPSEDLTRRIMADAERALGTPAANDVLPPDARSTPRPGWFHRLRVPLAVAASLTVAVLIGLQWRTAQHDEAPVLASTAPDAAAPLPMPPQTQPPQTLPPDAAVSTAPPAPDANASATPAKRAPTSTPADRTAPQDRRARERTMLAQQAPPPDLSSGAVIMRGMPAPEEASAAPGVPDNTSPQAWLAAIERLLADERPAEARRAWLQFRAAYPQFPVPEPLARRLDALQP